MIFPLVPTCIWLPASKTNAHQFFNLAFIASEGQEPDNIKGIKGLEIDQREKEIVLRFTNGDRNDVAIIRPGELWLAIFNAQYYEINDLRVPKEIRDDFRDCQRRMREGEGLIVGSTNLPNMLAQIQPQRYMFHTV